MQFSSRPLRGTAAVAALAALAGCSSDAITAVSSPATPSLSRSGEGHVHARVCSTPSGPREVSCHSWVRVDGGTLQPLATSGPAGHAPADLLSAYKLPTTAGTSWVWNGQTIAIVDAYDDPNAASDLAVYRAQFGLPACTTSSGCFSKVNQSGGTTNLPRANSGWAEEISLDLDMASAICPQCKILLVEASSTSMTSLGTAVNTAVRLGANVVSNSYGGSEYASEVNDETSYFNHPGVAITVSSGDNGYGVEFPAASRYVTAVGGTSLTKASNTRGWTESVWSGAGAGCSSYIGQPTWQTTNSQCQTHRTVADVAAVADPNTGVSVYDTYNVSGGGGWLVFGGTSVASPIIASIYALSGNAGSVNYGSYPYGHLGSLFDVVAGNDGTCGGTYLCNGVAGYDGPTGNGTPNGLGAF